jgi:hypothetical protein
MELVVKEFIVFFIRNIHLFLPKNIKEVIQLLIVKKLILMKKANYGL